jgi:hypothetical protein
MSSQFDKSVTWRTEILTHRLTNNTGHSRSQSELVIGSSRSRLTTQEMLEVGDVESVDSAMRDY